MCTPHVRDVLCSWKRGGGVNISPERTRGAVVRVRVMVMVMFQNRLFYPTKIFLKCPSRVQYFKEMAPNIPLPPQPVLTRWGTWLKVATYFCEHFEILKTIILGLNKNDSTSVEKAQDLTYFYNLPS